MKYGTLHIEIKEYQTLKRILSGVPKNGDESYRISMQKFQHELQSAKRCEASKIPDDVVRFDSEVTIKDSQSNICKYKIVTPEHGDIAKGMVSILAPMGHALFGYAVSDVVSWQFPSGIRTITIMNVEQKEIENEKHTVMPKSLRSS